MNQSVCVLIHTIYEAASSPTPTRTQATVAHKSSDFISRRSVRRLLKFPSVYFFVFARACSSQRVLGDSSNFTLARPRTSRASPTNYYTYDYLHSVCACDILMSGLRALVRPHTRTTSTHTHTLLIQYYFAQVSASVCVFRVLRLPSHTPCTHPSTRLTLARIMFAAAALVILLLCRMRFRKLAI